MLSNKEFAVFNKCPEELSPEMAEMAMFTLDMGKTLVESGRDENGHRIIKRLFNKKVWINSDLWTVKGKKESRKIVKSIREKPETEIKAENIKRYAELVEKGMVLFEGQKDIPLTSDEEFFALDTELIGGKCRRKGGIKNHDGFESLVDG